MTTRPGLVHLHCGDAAAAVHRKSGLPGDLVVWRDSPAVGPWTAEREDLAALRATWWGVPRSEWRDPALLEDLVRAPEPVLWFGPDPWEQACLLWILGELPEGALVDLVPLERGAGRMDPRTLARSFAARVHLDTATRAQARDLWRAFLRGGWGSLGQDGLPAMPDFGPALARLAEDHPPAGLGRTRRQIHALLAGGVRDLPALMEALGAMEAPRHGAWYGDLAVARMVEATGVRIG